MTSTRFGSSLALALALAVAFLSAVQVAAQTSSFSLAPAGSAAEAKVTATLVSEVRAAAPGQPFRVAVKLVHAPDHHTYGKVLPPGVVGKPTTVKWTAPEGWKVDELAWPPTHQLTSTDGKVTEGYDGTVYLPAVITPSGPAGSSGEISAKVDALVCDPKTCMPFKAEPRLSVSLAAEVELDPAMAEVFNHPVLPGAAVPRLDAGAVAAPAQRATRSFAGYLVLAFLGGLILNIMPCVFPVLGIKVLGVVQQAGGDKRQVVMHGFAYTAGVLICFLALGALVVAVGQTWGFQLQSPSFLFGLTAFFLVFALNMAGLFEIGASAVGVGANLQTRHGYGGSFFTGLLATVVATPCSAPFLGSALGFAVTLPMTTALVMFGMIGLGLASPFLFLSLLPGLVSALPRPGAWMESFKQGMAFLLFGTVAYLLWVLIDKVEGQPMLFLLLGLVLVAIGCWIYGRWMLPHKPVRTRLTAGLFAVAAVAGGLWMGWPQPEEKWEPWSPERVRELRAAKTPVYIDFTAKWCVTCQFNKRVYKDARIKTLMKAHEVVLLKADWTNEDERITNALAELGKAAVPVNVLYIPGVEEPHVLPELLTVDNVSAALARLGAVR